MDGYSLDVNDLGIEPAVSEGGIISWRSEMLSVGNGG